MASQSLIMEEADALVSQHAKNSSTAQGKSGLCVQELLDSVAKLDTFVAKKSSNHFHVVDKISLLRSKLSSNDSDSFDEEEVVSITLALSVALLRSCPASLKITSVALELVEHILPRLFVASEDAYCELFFFLEILNPKSSTGQLDDQDTEDRKSLKRKIIGNGITRSPTSLCQIAQAHPRFLKLLVCICISINIRHLSSSRALVLVNILHYLACHSLISTENRSIASGALQMLTLRLTGSASSNGAFEPINKLNNNIPEKSSDYEFPAPADTIKCLILELLPQLEINYHTSNGSIYSEEPYTSETEHPAVVLLYIFDQLLNVVLYCLESKVSQVTNVGEQAQKSLAEGRLSIESFMQIVENRKIPRERPCVSYSPFIEGADVVTSLDIIRVAILKILEDPDSNLFRKVVVWLRTRYIPALIEFSALIGLVAFPLSVVLRVMVSLAALFATKTNIGTSTFGFSITPEEYCLFIHFLACQISTSDEGSLSTKRRHIVALQALIEHVMGTPHVLRQILKTRKRSTDVNLVSDCIVRSLTRVTERLGYIVDNPVNISEGVEAIRNSNSLVPSPTVRSSSYTFTTMRAMSLKPPKSTVDVSKPDVEQSKLVYFNLFRPPQSLSHTFLNIEMAVGQVQKKQDSQLVANWRRSRSWMNLSAGQKEFRPVSDESAALVGATHCLNTGKILSKCRIDLSVEWFLISVATLTSLFPAEYEGSDLVNINGSKWELFKRIDINDENSPPAGQIACFKEATPVQECCDDETQKTSDGDSASHCRSSNSMTLIRSLLKLGTSLMKLPSGIVESLNPSIPRSIDIAYISLSIISYVNGDFHHPIDLLVESQGTGRDRVDDHYVFTLLLRLALHSGKGLRVEQYKIVWQSVYSILSRACLNQRRSLSQWIMEDIAYVSEFPSNEEALKELLLLCICPKTADFQTFEDEQTIATREASSLHLPSEKASTAVVAACILCKLSNLFWQEHLITRSFCNATDGERFFKIHLLFQALKACESVALKAKFLTHIWHAAEQFEGLAYFESLSQYIMTQINHLNGITGESAFSQTPANMSLTLMCVNFLIQLCGMLAEYASRFVVNVFALVSKLLLNQDESSPLIRPLWDAMAFIMTILRLNTQGIEPCGNELLALNPHIRHKKRTFIDSQFNGKAETNDDHLAEDIFTVVESTINAKGSHLEGNASLILLTTGLLHSADQVCKCANSRTASTKSNTLLPLKAISVVWTLCDTVYSRNSQETDSSILKRSWSSSYVLDGSPFELVNVEELLRYWGQDHQAESTCEVESFWAFDSMPSAQKVSRDVIVEELVQGLGKLSSNGSAPVRLAGIKSLTAIISAYASREQQGVGQFCHILYSNLIKHSVSMKDTIISEELNCLNTMMNTSNFRELEDMMDSWTNTWNEYKAWDENLIYLVEKSPVCLRPYFLEMGLDHYISGMMYDDITRLKAFKDWSTRVQGSGHAAKRVKEFALRAHSLVVQDHSLGISQLLKWMCTKSITNDEDFSSKVSWEEFMQRWLTLMKKKRDEQKKHETLLDMDLMIIDGLAEIIGKFGHSAYHNAIEKENSPNSAQIVSRGDILQLTLNGTKWDCDWSAGIDKLFLWIVSALLDVKMGSNETLGSIDRDEGRLFIRELMSQDANPARLKNLWIGGDSGISQQLTDIASIVFSSKAGIDERSRAYLEWNSFMDMNDDSTRAIKQARALGIPSSITSMTSFLCSSTFLGFIMETPYPKNGLFKMAVDSLKSVSLDTTKNSAVESLWVQCAIQIIFRSQRIGLAKAAETQANETKLHTEASNSDNSADYICNNCLVEILAVDDFRNRLKHCEDLTHTVLTVQYLLYHNLLFSLETLKLSSGCIRNVLQTCLNWLDSTSLNRTNTTEEGNDSVTNSDPYKGYCENRFQELIMFCLMGVAKCALITNQDDIVETTRCRLNELTRLVPKAKFDVIVGHFCLCDTFQVVNSGGERMQNAFCKAYGIWIELLKLFIDDLKIKVLLKKNPPANDDTSGGLRLLSRMFSFRSASNRLSTQTELSDEEKYQLLRILRIIRRGADWQSFDSNNAKQQMIRVMIGSVEFDDKLVRQTASESLKVLIGLEVSITNSA